MASFAANGLANVPPDHATNSEPTGVGSQPWLEPFLIKHSKFYRKHFTKNGDGMTKTERRASVISQDEERLRRQSAATDDSTAAGKAPEQPTGV